MSTVAERQRDRRRRLRQKGILDVTVTVPEGQRAALREFAQGLRMGRRVEPPPRGAGSLVAAIRALKSIRPDLERAGVRHAGVFGSVARGDDRPGSDIDIVIEIDAKRVGDIVAYAQIVERIKNAVRARCPDAAVDVADRAGLKPRVRPSVERDAVHAF